MAVASSQPPSFLSESEGSASGGDGIHGTEAVVVRFETGTAENAGNVDKRPRIKGSKKKKKKVLKLSEAPLEPPVPAAPGATPPTMVALEAERTAQMAAVDEDRHFDGSSVQASVYDYEKLQVMKAKTMYEMVEELDTGQSTVKMLFLTNPQADSICSSSYTLRKMLEALEIDSPKLVINLISSKGLRRSLGICSESFYKHLTFAGLVHNQPPFLNLDEEQMCLAKLDKFMVDVLLPLAASTQALLMVNGIAGECALSDALSRSYRMQKTKWGPKPPFVILSVTDDLPWLYLNNNPDAYWKILRRRSKAWRSRDKVILETVHTYGTFGCKPDDGHDFTGYDLDRDATTFLIVDQVDSNQRGFDSNPTNALNVEIMRFLANTVPSLALKTCWANKSNKSNTTGYQVCLDQANSGTKLLIMDVRRRAPLVAPISPSLPSERFASRFVSVGPQPTTSPVTQGQRGAALVEPEEVMLWSRAKYIEAAWEQLDAYRQSLKAKGLCESLDVCAVAYAHDFLLGSMNKKADRPGETLRRLPVPLYEAIRVARRERQNHTVSEPDEEPDSGSTATEEQVMDTAQRLAKFATEDAFEVLDPALQTAENKALFWQQSSEMFSHLKCLLVHPNVHSVNIHDSDSCRRTLDTMVQSDSLPKKNALEGLLLLREAWCELDVANFLANKYKFQTKALYFAQLLFAWLVVLNSQLDFSGFGSSFSAADAVFVLTVISGAVISVESFVKPKPKWQALRKGAFKLESVLWCYRTRVGHFKLGQGIDVRVPETMLCQRLNAWSEELMAAADLKRSAWSRTFPPHVFKHNQHADSPSGFGDLGDDHYSPVPPELYIEYRMLERMSWYKKRIPRYTFHAFAFKILLLSCVVACSILARFGLAVVAVIVTAFASGATTWAEFVDAESKVERYTQAVRTISDLLNWWRNLSEVEKASSENISLLVLETEHAIFSEQSSWMSTSVAKTEDSKTGGKSTEADASEVDKSPAAKQRGRVKGGDAG